MPNSARYIRLQATPLLQDVSGSHSIITSRIVGLRTVIGGIDV